MDTSFWNQRYNQPEYAYGEDPNSFLKEALSKLTPGKILFVAEGEGRNAVFAAKLGWKVFAFDISEAGRQKAIQLAHKNKVSIAYEVGDALSFEWPEQHFDVVALIYSHLPAEKRKQLHFSIPPMLKKNGLVILEGFSLNNLAYSAENPNIGGPKDPHLLFTLQLIESEFEGLEIQQLEEKLIALSEGKYHRGNACVIRYIGKSTI